MAEAGRGGADVKGVGGHGPQHTAAPPTDRPARPPSQTPRPPWRKEIAIPRPMEKASVRRSSSRPLAASAPGRISNTSSSSKDFENSSSGALGQRRPMKNPTSSIASGTVSLSLSSLRASRAAVLGFRRAASQRTAITAPTRKTTRLARVPSAGACAACVKASAARKAHAGAVTWTVIIRPGRMKRSGVRPKTKATRAGPCTSGKGVVARAFPPANPSPMSQ